MKLEGKESVAVPFLLLATARLQVIHSHSLNLRGLIFNLRIFLILLFFFYPDAFFKAREALDMSAIFKILNLLFMLLRTPKGKAFFLPSFLYLKENGNKGGGLICFYDFGIGHPERLACI